MLSHRIKDDYILYSKMKAILRGEQNLGYSFYKNFEGWKKKRKKAPK